MTKRIIVTGGAGYIGSHTCIELIQRGVSVVVLDDLSNSSIDMLDKIEAITGEKPEFYKVDVSDGAALAQAFASIGAADGVIHFAAKKAVGESVEKPLLYYQCNVMGLVNVLKEMARHDVGRLIFSSSCTVYGQPEELPVGEASPIQKAQSPYGNTKQIGEEIIQEQISAVGEKLRCISLRYFNPVGAHPSGLIGELPLGVPANLMPYITQTAIGLRQQLKVYGDDYNTDDGTAVRDYIHVVDIAKAHVVAMDRLLAVDEAGSWEVFNLGTGTGSSVLEVIQSFERTSGLSLNYEIVGRRPGDVEAVYASTSKANKVLGWKAELTLDDMTRSAWLWEQNIRQANS